MAEIKKYLDLEGLKLVFQINKERIDAVKSEINVELAKKADADKVYEKSEVDTKIAETIAGSVDLTPYLKSETAEATYAKKSELEGLASESYVDSAISDAKDEILGEDLAEALETLETVKSWKEQHGGEYSNLLAEVNKKADSETVANTYATKAEVSAVEAKIPTDYLTDEDIEDLASEEYVDDAIEALNIEQYVKTADLPSFVGFTKEEIEGAANAE